ncbi:MAG: TlpA family protein disulfide reductase [Sporichthyaceae bacterium]
MARHPRASTLAAFLVAGLLLNACGGAEAADPAAVADAQEVLSQVVNGKNAPVLACTGLDSPLPGAPTAPAGGKALPDLRFECLGEGGALTLADLRGPMVLNVWASWCGPCRDELPYLSEAQAALGASVRFAAIALADTDDDSRSWMSYFGMTWPSLADPKGSVRGPLRIPGPPVTLFVRSDGTLGKTHYGAFTSTRQVMDAVTEQLGVNS